MIDPDLKQVYFNEYVAWKLDFMDENPEVPFCDLPTFEKYLKQKGVTLQDSPKIKKKPKKTKRK